jgi:hypothetical protein
MVFGFQTDWGPVSRLKSNIRTGVPSDKTYMTLVLSLKISPKTEPFVLNKIKMYSYQYMYIPGSGFSSLTNQLNLHFLNITGHMDENCWCLVPYLK